MFEEQSDIHCRELDEESDTTRQLHRHVNLPTQQQTDFFHGGMTGCYPTPYQSFLEQHIHTEPPLMMKYYREPSDQTWYGPRHNFKGLPLGQVKNIMIRMIRTSQLWTESFDFTTRNVNNNHLIHRLQFRAPRPLGPLVQCPLGLTSIPSCNKLSPKLLNQSFNRGLVTQCGNFSNVQIGA